MKNGILGLIVLVLFSCTGEKKIKNNTNEVEQEKEKLEVIIKEKFTVILRGIILKEDLFQVHYLNSGGEAYDGQKSISVSVKSSPDEQDIEFELPKGVYPHNLRIDIGDNKNQEEIRINEIIFLFEKYNFKIKGKEILKYFKPSPFIQVSNDSITYYTKELNFNNVLKYDPYLAGLKDLEEALLSEL